MTDTATAPAAEPKLITYTVEFEWYVPTTVHEEIEAYSLDEAVAEAKRMLEDDEILYDASKTIWEASTPTQISGLWEGDAYASHDLRPDAEVEITERSLADSLAPSILKKADAPFDASLLTDEQITAVLEEARSRGAAIAINDAPEFAAAFDLGEAAEQAAGTWMEDNRLDLEEAMCDAARSFYESSGPMAGDEEGDDPDAEDEELADDAEEIGGAA